MLYAAIPPRRSGWLDVGDGHRLHWEESGNPGGCPVAVVHGGPGGASTARNRRWFHPDYFRIISFDQRGCGRSLPHASIDGNTTDDLISDLERLREVLCLERWILMGQSWGAALALAYAEAHPDRVDAMILASVFTGRRSELEGLYPPDLALASHARLTCGVRTTELAAAHAWCAREDAVSSAVSRPPPPDDAAALARARIGVHYFLNRYFLRDGQLVANAARLQGIPGIIVHGRNDLVTPVAGAIDLHRAWAESRLHVVDNAGHSSCDHPLTRAIIAAADSLLPMARGYGAR
jgi:proline iminopeptidase